MLRSSLLALLALSTHVSATNYYFSSSIGRDTNTGTSPSSPWQTTNKFNDALSNRMSPGDNVYFCQGDTWLYAHLSSASSGVTYDSYNCRSGQTAKPVLSTAVQPAASAWSRVGSSDILVANYRSGSNSDPVALSEGIQAIWVGNVRYVTARWPALRNPVNTLTVGQTTWGVDGEFFRTSRQDGATLYSDDITQGDNYWTGAAIFVRVLNYAYLQFNVVASGQGWVRLHAAPGRAAGFYFAQTGSVSASNTLLKVKNPGEFSFDQNTGLLYLYPLSSSLGQNILSGSQPVSVLYNNLPAAFQNQGGVASVTVRNLHFKWAAGGIHTLSNQAMVIRDNDVSNIAGYGIWTQRNGAILVENNYVFDSESTCIVVQTTLKVTKNTVRQCGLYAGLGNWQATNGIVCSGGECSYNSVNMVGYIGISPTNRAFVTQNRVDWALLTLNDGGGIYGYGGEMAGVSLYSNTVTNMVGNWVSWTAWPIAPCYYLDTTWSVQLYNNTCTAAPSCVQMNSAQGHLIYSNICNAPGMYINQAIAPSVFLGNLVATTGTNTNLQNSLHRVQAPNRNTFAEIMSSGDNIYCIPPGADQNYLFQFVKSDLNKRYHSFSEWKGEVSASMPSFERGTAVYTTCRGLRAGFTGNDITSLPGYVEEMRRHNSNQLATQVAVPVTLVVVALIVLIAGLSYRSYRAKQQSNELPTTQSQSIEIELPQSSPTSSSNSSFFLMSSPTSASSVAVV